MTQRKAWVECVSSKMVVRLTDVHEGEPLKLDAEHCEARYKNRRVCRKKNRSSKCAKQHGKKSINVLKGLCYYFTRGKIML